MGKGYFISRQLLEDGGFDMRHYLLTLLEESPDSTITLTLMVNSLLGPVPAFLVDEESDEG